MRQRPNAVPIPPEVSENEYSERTRKEEREKKIVCVNNSQLCLQPPPQVAHASRLDQNYVLILEGLGLVQAAATKRCP